MNDKQRARMDSLVGREVGRYFSQNFNLDPVEAYAQGFRLGYTLACKEANELIRDLQNIISSNPIRVSEGDEGITKLFKRKKK